MSFISSAAFYDGINGEAYVPYAEYLTECFSKAAIPVKEVLDLGCGTGGICAILAKKGYDMIGIDNSADMLNIAYCANSGLNTLLLMQDMRSFELYGTVQAVYSSFDCLNYLGSAKELGKVFALVRNYLEPGGVFAFDVNTRFRYEKIFDGMTYAYESGEDMMVWRSALSDNGKSCEFWLDLFLCDGNGGYRRERETQRQTCFSREEITGAAAGFTLLSQTGGKGFDGCGEAEKDYYLFRRD